MLHIPLPTRTAQPAVHGTSGETGSGGQSAGASAVASNYPLHLLERLRTQDRFRSHQPSISVHRNVVNTDISELSAERLNLYINQKQDSRLSSGEARMLDNANVPDKDAVNVTFRDPEPNTLRKRWKQNFRIALPHVGLVFLSAAYTLLGATIFHHFETPYETHIRNATSQRVQVLKDKIIRSLLVLATRAQHANESAGARLIDEFWLVANNGMDAVIKDVFVDYTRHYMTPEDIIHGTGPTRWSFSSSVFFSWTAITTIGYGHIVPLTLEGRISCLLYALFGIPLILVTIADMGRFLSGGIIWVHNTFRKIRKGTLRRCRFIYRVLCCRFCWRRQKAAGAVETRSIRLIRSIRSGTAVTINGEPATLTASNAIAMDVATVNDGETNGSAGKQPIALLEQLISSMKKRRRKRKQTPNSRHPLFRRRRGSDDRADVNSDAGTFEDISEIRTQENSNDKTASSSVDTRAQADVLVAGAANGDEDGEESDNDDEEDGRAAGVTDEEKTETNGGEEEEDDDNEYDELHAERRVSVLFILVVMLGYTAGGACLMQLWERWKFVDAFYFCFVTVTTIGFGDIVPQNADFLPATLAYIVVGLIITTMCIDLVGSEYIRDIHFYGRTLGRTFMTIGGKVVHLGEVFSYVAFLQKSYGLTPDQLGQLTQLPEEYLMDCLINGRQPDLNWIGGRPFIPPEIYYFKWIEQSRTLSFTSERVLASVDSEHQSLFHG